MLHKGGVGLAFAFVLLTGYFFIGYTVPSDAVRIALPIDHQIPFIPITSWYYLPFFPVALLVALIAMPTPEDLHSALKAMTLAGCINFTFFIFMPTAYPRPPMEGFGVLAAAVPYPVLEIPGDIYSRAFMGFIHWFDPPSCTFPSGHVTFPVCLGLGLWRSRPRIAHFLLLGSALFWVSTWTTKQHFVVDGIAGAFTGWLGYRLFWKRKA